jgi:hypothetical protein
MDRIPDVDILNSPIDVPEEWIQTIDDNVVASKFPHCNQSAHIEIEILSLSP